jgi:hypothetical protein
LLPNDATPIKLSPDESVGDVVFVSGMQGLIATTSMAEDFDRPPGENNPKPVCILVELATPMDFFMPVVTIPS